MSFINFFVFNNPVVFSMSDDEEDMTTLMSESKSSSSRKRSQISPGAATSQELPAKRIRDRLMAIDQYHDNHSRLRVAESQLKSDDESEQEIGRTAIRSIAQNQCFFSAAEFLLKSDDENNQEIGRAALRSIAQKKAQYDKNEPVKFLLQNGEESIGMTIIQGAGDGDIEKAATLLFKSDNQEDKKIGRDALSSISLDQKEDDYSRFRVAKFLLESDDEGDQEIGRIALRSLAQKEGCHEGGFCYAERDAAIFLFQSDNQEDKKIGRDRLIRIAENEKSTVGVSAAEFLFKNERDEDVRNIVRETLYTVIQHPQWYYRANSKEVYTDHLALLLDTAKFLIKEGNEEDKNKGEEVIQNAYKIACRLKESKRLRSLGIIQFRLTEKHPIGFSALRDFFYCGNSRYSLTAEKTLLKIAKKESHPHQYRAAKVLYDTGKTYYYKGGDIRGREILISIAKQEGHPNQAEARQTLESESGGCLIL